MRDWFTNLSDYRRSLSTAQSEIALIGGSLLILAMCAAMAYSAWVDGDRLFALIMLLVLVLVSRLLWRIWDDVP